MRNQLVRRRLQPEREIDEKRSFRTCPLRFLKNCLKEVFNKARFFQIAVQPEKEMVMILAPKEQKDDILHALYKGVGLNTPGQGIAFSMPVDSVVGLRGAQTE